MEGRVRYRPTLKVDDPTTNHLIQKNFRPLVNPRMNISLIEGTIGRVGFPRQEG